MSLVPDGKNMKGKVYDFSEGFAMFNTKKDVTEKDIKGDENKIEKVSKGYRFLRETKRRY